MSYPVIADLFATVVTSVSTVLGYSVYYHHGHMLEITNVVKKLSSDPDVDKRYPIAALVHDIPQKRTLEGIQFDCKIYLITLSDPTFLAQDRMTTIFKPILHPLYNEFLKQIARSGLFLEQTVTELNQKTRYTERLFWGRQQVMGNDANIFGDWVDCIEIDFTGLTALCTC